MEKKPNILFYSGRSSKPERKNGHEPSGTKVYFRRDHVLMAMHDNQPNPCVGMLH